MKIKTNIYLKKFYPKDVWIFPTYVFAFLILSGVFSSADTDEKVYLCTGTYFLIGGICACLRDKIKYINVIIYLFAAMFSIWAYGIMIGIINGNDQIMMIRNFAGLVTYFMIIPMYCIGFNKIKMMRLILYVSAIIPILSIIAYIDWQVLHLKYTTAIPFVNAYIGSGGFGHGFIQYFSYRISYVGYAYSLHKMMNMGKLYTKHLINVGLVLFATIFLFDSGADILVAAIIPIVLLLAQRRRQNRVTLLMLGAAATALFLIIFLLQSSLLGYVFSPEDIGNKRRYEEIALIVRDLTFWGKGLGAALGKAGSYGKINYATEVIYLNLIHKFGVVSILIFGIYLFTLIKGYKILCNGEKEYGNYKVIPLACMTYLINSIANPILFMQTSVFLHCIALILIVDYEGIHKNAKLEQGKIDTADWIGVLQL